MAHTPKIPPLTLDTFGYKKIQRTDLIARKQVNALQPGRYEMEGAGATLFVEVLSFNTISPIVQKAGSTDMFIYNIDTDVLSTGIQEQITAIVAAENETVKLPVRVAATANVDISVLGLGGNAVDGVIPVVGNRIFFPFQTDKTQCGIYVFNGADQLVTRATDFNEDTDVKSGILIIVTDGKKYDNMIWELINIDPIIIGTTGLDFIITTLNLLQLTKQQLVNLRTYERLISGQKILITDLAEPLIVTALGSNKIDVEAKSPSFPYDIIHYDTSNADISLWKIIYRKDTVNNLSVQGLNSDFRSIAIFGAECKNIEIRKNGNINDVVIGANCVDLYIDMATATATVTIPINTVNRRWEQGFSNFEATIDINGLATIDLTGAKHCGIINLISSSDADTEQIDIISNASGNHPITFRPSGTLTVNWRDLGMSGGNLKLEISPTTLDGTSRDFIEFEKVGNNMNLVNVRNYLPFLASP